MPRKLTNPEFIAKCTTVHGDKYDYSNTLYVGNDKPMSYRCPAHGEVIQRANDHLSKKAGCPECGGVKRLTKESFSKRASEVHKGKYTYEKVIYVNVETKVEITCSDHGSFWQTPHDHLTGHGCAKCAGLHPLDTDEFIRRAVEAHGDKYGYEKAKYLRSRAKVTITCNKHKLDFEQEAIQHLSGRGCPICGGVKHRTTQDFVEKARGVHGDRYAYENSIFVSKTENIAITCHKHKDFWQLPHNHLKGGGCPSCASIDKSKQERLLNSELAEFKPISDKTVLGGKQLDLYFPEHKLAVEVNGVYWHAKHDNSYHVGKSNDCSDSGIQLLHFTDVQINTKLPIVLSMIRHHLEVSGKIQARKCVTRQIKHSEAFEFLNRNHISGVTTAKLSYGAFHNGELVSAMSFSKPRFTKGCEWEIIRYATKLDTCVVGGASKLFAHFLKEVNPASVMSYADKMYGNGGVYAQLGFTYERDTECGYSYHHKDGRVIGRVSAQKHKLQKLLGDKFEFSKTEVENMKASGFHRLYDCGHKVFVWHKPT